MSIGIKVKGFFKGITAFTMWCAFRPITSGLFVAAILSQFMVALPFLLCNLPFKKIAQNPDLSTFVKVLTAPLWFPLRLAALALGAPAFIAAALGSRIDKMTAPIIGNDLMWIGHDTVTDNEKTLYEKATTLSWFAGWKEMWTGKEIKLTFVQEVLQQLQEEEEPFLGSHKPILLENSIIKGDVYIIEGKEIAIFKDPIDILTQLRTMHEDLGRHRTKALQNKGIFEDVAKDHIKQIKITCEKYEANNIAKPLSNHGISSNDVVVESIKLVLQDAQRLENQFQQNAEAPDHEGAVMSR
ncbi:hypothetical protein RLOatenuis_7140 [Rickettsiales bacterium]|nr:hypothetical protein RLOatenuis_7140 [Rickettsiales bacterium]